MIFSATLVSWFVTLYIVSRVVITIIYFSFIWWRIFESFSVASLPFFLLLTSLAEACEWAWYRILICYFFPLLVSMRSIIYRDARWWDWDPLQNPISKIPHDRRNTKKKNQEGWEGGGGHCGGLDHAWSIFKLYPSFRQQCTGFRMTGKTLGKERKKYIYIDRERRQKSLASYLVSDRHMEGDGWWQKSSFLPGLVPYSVTTTSKTYTM